MNNFGSSSILLSSETSGGSELFSSLQIHLLNLFFLVKLYLYYDIMYIHTDSPLLNCRGFFKTISINAAQQFFAQIHIVKVFANFVPVWIDETVGIHSGGTIITGRTSSAIFIARLRSVGFPPSFLRGGGSANKREVIKSDLKKNLNQSSNSIFFLTQGKSLLWPLHLCKNKVFWPMIFAIKLFNFLIPLIHKVGMSIKKIVILIALFLCIKVDKWFSKKMHQLLSIFY